MLRWVSLFCAISLGLFGTLMTNTASIRVGVSQISQIKGTVKWALYDNEKAYEQRTPAVKSGSISVTGESLTWEVTGLAPGPYALAIYHDVNNNGVLDLNFLGVPKEPYAFSGTSSSKWLPPSFDKAAVQVAKNTLIKISFP